MNRLFLFFSFFVPLIAQAQPEVVASTATLMEYPNLDTVKFYAVTLREELIDGKIH